jgi:hypothetical protein
MQIMQRDAEQARAQGKMVRTSEAGPPSIPSWPPVGDAAAGHDLEVGI